MELHSPKLCRYFAVFFIEIAPLTLRQLNFGSDPAQAVWQECLPVFGVIMGIAAIASIRKQWLEIRKTSNGV
jgi:hypothetical protein